MSGAVTDAISILSAAIMPNSPTFVKKPVFSEEVVSQKIWLIDQIKYNCYAIFCQQINCKHSKRIKRFEISVNQNLCEVSNRDRAGSVCILRPVFQVDVLRLRTEGQPDMMKVEQIVTQLEQADQVTQQTLDDMLCQTPTGKRKPIMEERRISRRTLQPLRSTLLSEWERLSVVSDWSMSKNNKKRL